MAQDKKDVEALSGALQRVTVDGGDNSLAGVEESLSPSERAAVLKLKQLQGLPNFWLRALKANRLLADVIEEHDEGPLSYLQDIRCEWLVPKEAAAAAAAGDTAGAAAATAAAAAAAAAEGEENNTTIEGLHGESFRLVFTFRENPYFSSLVLKKEYILGVCTPSGDNKGGAAAGGAAATAGAAATGAAAGAAELIKCISNKIEWYKEKDITKKIIIRKQRNKKTKQIRTITETVNNNSFFNLFNCHDIPSDDKLQQMDEKEVEELQMVVEADYDIGITIRDKIIPRAVEWYLGQVDDDSDFDDYDINDEEFDSEESEEEEDSSDEEPPRSHKGHHRH
ncbi:nucleosome assembly protein, putative [Eimeria maxima]|uniref:Nucleosome assembly protein, putative n=1 Tax=Eimeria maxima TaxID=5804 RepID=U6M551_EIMMA|nr:nucleosome assembly protein, putative [Eimeria maxima]CDJ57549.1 nucleosome assembly protein, putative [Eimeria maxima]